MVTHIRFFAHILLSKHLFQVGGFKNQMGQLKLTLTEEQKGIVRNVITRVPKNEEELKRIFFKLEDVLGFEHIRVFEQFPDASAFYQGREIEIEFEKYSSNFKQHKHKEDLCDLIICWENDDSSLEIPVLELSTLADNWLKAREEAISEYIIYIMQRANNVKNKNLAKELERIRYLLDKYDITHEDAMAYHMGMTVKGVKRYTSGLGEKPECMGGKLVCEKRDLDVTHLEINSNYQKLVPVVLCKDCRNKENCQLGKKKQIGYFFILYGDKKRPRKVGIEIKPIKDEKILSHAEKTQHNIWKGIQFNRR